MSRINVTDDDGALVGWFDPDKATGYDERTRWDGNDSVSLTAGKQHHHYLWRTATGRWVLHSWSQWVGARDAYKYLTDDQAREWLMRNEYDSAEIEQITGEEIPDEPPVMGRPAIGPQIKIRLDPDVLARIDDLADAAGVTRSAWVRSALEAAVANV